MYMHLSQVAIDEKLTVGAMRSTKYFVSTDRHFAVCRFKKKRDKDLAAFRYIKQDLYKYA